MAALMTLYLDLATHKDITSEVAKSIGAHQLRSIWHDVYDDHLEISLHLIGFLQRQPYVQVVRFQRVCQRYWVDAVTPREEYICSQ